MPGICLLYHRNKMGIHLLFKHLRFSWVPLVWTDTCIHHKGENTISFLSRITFSRFILRRCAANSTRHNISGFLIFFQIFTLGGFSLATHQFWHSCSSCSSLIVLRLSIFSIFPVALKSQSKEFQLVSLFHLCYAVCLYATTTLSYRATESLLVPHTMVFQQRVNRGCS